MAVFGFAMGSGYGNSYIDSLIWGGNPGAGKWTGGPITYYFGSGPYPDDPADGFDPTGSPFARAWLESEKNAFRTALQLYENITALQFQEVGAIGDANLRWWLLDSNAAPYYGRHQVPSGQYGPELDGIFNYQDSTWADLTQGSFGFITIIHELGHGLGLAHPHDGGNGPNPTTFPGVKLFHAYDTGDFGLNQGIWTTMGYNDGWNLDPGVFPHYGYQGTPMAFDIAALQTLYGANTTYHTGDDLYALPGKNASGTFWSCIWDAGGDADLISADGITAACKINLNAASLMEGDPNAGGFASWVSGIHGGFTIANKVVIENATGGNGADTLTGNEVGNILTGNAGNDSLIGGLGTDTLDGGLGTDRMAGGAGDDLYLVDVAKDVAIEIVGEGTADTVDSFASYVLGAEIEILELEGNAAINGTGNALANTLVGNSAANVLDGGLGADTMKGGLGNDTYLVDALGDKTDETGGDGADTVKSSIDGYTLNAAVENLTLVGKAISGFGNELANIIIGTTAGNALSGLDGNDSLVGDKGNDSLDGGNHDDTLDGGAGLDTMAGSAGNDLYRIDVAGDQITGADAGTDTVESLITFILGLQQENLTLIGTAAINGTGNDSGNVITGNTGANILSGGTKGEADSLIGGAGNDTYLVDSSSDKVTEGDKGGTDLVKSSQTYNLSQFSEFVENLTLLPGAGNIDGTGNGSNNVITGNEGNNRLDGGKGNDVMTGGNGDDTYVVDSPGDKVTEGGTALAGHDTVESKITYTLGANVEDLDLSAGGAINGTGNALANLIIGSTGANKLDGKAGADTMQGDLGDDTYVIDNLADQVDEKSGDGSDTIQIATAFDLQAPTIAILGVIENVTLIGTAAINASGDGGANHLTGNSGANTLDGRGGNDVLDGLGGADLMIGGTGDDTYVVDNAKDVVQEAVGDAADLIKASISTDLAAYAEIEDVTLTGTAALKATGDEQKNHLTGNAGANLLTGNDGADTLVGDAGNDTLDGGAGVDIDSLAGGLGNDTYIIAAPDDIVSEAPGEGIDTVRSAVPTYTLEANVENLVLLAGMLNGYGNDLNNLMTGNDANNTLFGGAGADTLVGGKGSNVYYVDDAKDVVTEVTGVGSGIDEVATTISYTLGAYVENLTLMPGAGSISGTGNTLDNAITGNEGDNTLDGKTGKDYMFGAGGNDTYIVDNVGDFVDETGGSTSGDTVKSSITFSLVQTVHVLAGEVENLTLTGAGAISGTGNELANHLIGNAGANKLFGNGAGDIIEGGAGADTIDGGAGNDSITGGAGNDRIDVGTGDDTVFYTSKLDGKDVIDNFSSGHDRLDLDGLFDTLALPGIRADHVSVVDNGASVDVRVDADGKAGFELVVATLNTTDTITVGVDIVVGS